MRDINRVKQAVWVAVGLGVAAAAWAGENWPHWRGPEYTGASMERGLPERFSRSENVRWVAEMPGPAAATPIIWGERVFISSTGLETKTLRALCFDRRNGKLLWEQEAGVGFRKDDRSNYASASPVTDGERVIFFYGNGDLVAFKVSGEKVWSRNIQRDYGSFAFLWTFSTSPTLYEGRLYIQVLQRNGVVGGNGRVDGPNDSYILALDPATGTELWRQVRPAEAREESLEGFTTPIPFRDGGRRELLVAGGDCVTGHDLVTGREVWRWGTWNPTRITHWRLVPSPVAGGGVVLACAPKGAPVYAIKAGGSGDLGEGGLVWRSEDRLVSSDVSTPLFYGGRFYILNSDRRALACVEPGTGKVFWTGEIGGRAKIEASPTGADGKIYVMNHRGDVFVLAAGDEFKVLHRAEMGEPEANDLRSSVAAAQGNLFVRTSKKLYCIGNFVTGRVEVE